ncbi:MAG: [FeFe] hydrogenase H-cluster maturation GTPase HydF, partial [Rhodospirillaceae bacterium]
MQSTPRALRLHIGIFGRRNVGKSSLLNAITRQDVSIVSDVAGTTTDPVEKPMELLPLGPVLFVDTAGVDDEGALGELRMQRTRAILDRVDLGVVVTEAGAWGSFEDGLVAQLKQRTVPVVVAVNKIDERPLADEERARLLQAGDALVAHSAQTGNGVGDVREALLRLAPADHFDSRRIIADLVPPGAVAVLVVPIDKEAPKGRIILPQVMAIRDLLDGGSAALVVQDRGLRQALDGLAAPPALVVTDSQAFATVAAVVPPQVPMTSFSILMARFQGDLAEQVRGTLAIEQLANGDRILVAETCTHHPIGDDIGRIKIPKWLSEYTGASLEFAHVQGRDFPADLAPYRIVVHCGNCTGNRREMLSRIHRCREAGVPIT